MNKHFLQDSFYTCHTLDTFDLIAYKIYNDESKAKEIMEASENRQHIGKTFFSAGDQVFCPEIIEEITTDKPKWMQDT